MRRLPVPLSRSLALVAISLAFSAAALAQAWTAYVNPRFGFQLYYPVDLFEAGEDLPEDSGKVFVGKDGATLRAVGAYDENRRGAKHYLGEALADAANANVVSQSLEDFSYSFTSDRGDMLHFQQGVFSCREQIINTLSLTYPETEKQKYAEILPKLTQRFNAGSGYDTPDNCV